jgi:Tfp pilus assembly PilM family ATPase
MMGMTKRYSPIGIEIGVRSVQAAQLAGSRGNWRFHAGVSVPLPVPNHPTDAAIARHLGDVLYRHGFVGEDVVLAAPVNQLEADVLELPPRSSGAPVEQIARLEMARSAKLENEPFELECWDLPTPSRGAAGASVMAVALRHAHANALLDPFDAAGLNVVAIDARCCALARASMGYQQPDAMLAVLDVDWDFGQVALISQGMLVYQRSINESQLSMVCRSIGDELQLEEDEIDYVLKHIGAGAEGADPEMSTLAQSRRIQQLITRYLDTVMNEAETAFQYAAHRYAQTPIKTLLLTGPGAGIAGACGLIASRTNLETRVLSPASIVECPKDLHPRCEDASLTVALGLAMNGAARS